MTGGILLIDYGYLDDLNKSTLQAVMKNKKIDIKTSLSINIGKSDITSLVNFKLLKRIFFKKEFKRKKNSFSKIFFGKNGYFRKISNFKKEIIF